MKQKICPGSNRWAPTSHAVGKGKCSTCGKLIERNISNGNLFTHKRIEKK